MRIHIKFTAIILALMLLAMPAGAVSPWAKTDVSLADALGLIPYSVSRLSGYITRAELCELEICAYEAITGTAFPKSYENPFVDTDSPYVAAASYAGLVNGRDDHTFAPNDYVTREEAARFFVALAAILGIEPEGKPESFYDIYDISAWAVEYVKTASAYGYLTADYRGLFLPEEKLSVEQAIIVMVRMYSDVQPKIVVESGETFAPYTGTGDYVYNGRYRRNDPDDVFTDGPITTKAQADAQMTDITVDIWELKNGEKVPGKLTLTVHKNIAGVLTEVFADIYNGQERFPIDPDGTYCYSFRTTAGTSRLSEHATGTAIDINPDQNYCVYSDGSTVGSLYAPGENPYSIEKFGDCWNAFVSHGFTWGGDAWSGTKDYMHFSYLGR